MTSSAPPTKPDAPQALTACWLARREVARIACTQLDVRDPRPYWRAVLGPSWRGPYPRHWCGALALWCLHEAGLCDWIWSISKVNAPKGRYGFGYRLTRTTTPEVGDIGYIDKPYQHHFVVVETTGTEVVSIDGNQEKAPGVVRERRRKLGAATYFSIAQLLPAGPQNIA